MTKKGCITFRAEVFWPVENTVQHREQAQSSRQTEQEHEGHLQTGLFPLLRSGHRSRAGTVRAAAEQQAVRQVSLRRRKFRFAEAEVRRDSEKFVGDEVTLCLKEPGNILKGDVSLYHWPPVWLIWISLFCKWIQKLSGVIQLIPNQTNRRSTVQWYFPLLYSL